MFVDKVFTVSKTGEQWNNEDCEGDNENWTVIADGATTKTATKFKDGTGGQIVARLICKTVLSSPHTVSPKQLLKKINKEYIKKLGNLPKEESPSAVFVAVNKTGKWIIRVGDLGVRVDDKAYEGNLRIDKVHSEMRKLYSHLLIESQKSSEKELLEDDLGRKLIYPSLQLQWVVRNHPTSPYGYGAVDGREIPDKFVEYWEIPANTRRIILTTDGYLKPEASLKDVEKTLEKTLKEDPLMINSFPSTKGLESGNASFDDRTFIELKRALF